MLIKETEHVELHFQPGEGDFLLLAFAPLSYEPDATRFWGHTLVAKLGCPCLAFMDKGATWYPANDMDTLVEAALPIVAQYQRRIAYGSSMGGYAAVKYSKKLRATTTISMSPQYSINPADVPFDKRYHTHFNPLLHADMRIDPAECGGNAFVISDPWQKEDALHNALIKQALPETTFVPAYLSSHSTVILFRSSSRARALFRSAEAADAATIRRLIREGGKATPAIRIRAAVEFNDHRPKRAEALLDRFETILLSDHVSRISVAQMRRKIMETLLAQNDLRGAARNALKALCTAPNDGLFLETLSDLLFRQGEDAAAHVWLKRCIEANPSRASAHHLLARHLARAGRFREAIAAAHEGVKHSHEHPVAMKMLAEYYARSGEVQMAIEWSSRAAREAPANVWLQVFAARTLIDSKDAQGALGFIEAAERVAPAEDARVTAATVDLRARFARLPAKQG